MQNFIALFCLKFCSWSTQYYCWDLRRLCFVAEISVDGLNILLFMLNIKKRSAASEKSEKLQQLLHEDSGQTLADLATVTKCFRIVRNSFKRFKCSWCRMSGSQEQLSSIILYVNNYFSSRKVNSTCIP